MQQKSIIITGAAGFIGSCLTGFLNKEGHENLILVDDFSRKDKLKNLVGKKYLAQIDRKNFFSWLEKNGDSIAIILHMGARTDTTEFSWDIFKELNLDFSQKVWEFCTHREIPLIYASSGATYGNGESGYSDDELPEKLHPLNPYGKSKNEFDKWALKQNEVPVFWAGLKFFNVYGPNEYHKSRMASVVFHIFQQVNSTGKAKLFRSHRPDFADGMQLRDFIYVKDIISVIYFLMKNKPRSGIYNLGTGKAQSFLELAKCAFKAMGKPENIEFIDIPEDIRDKYQYFTEADMKKLRQAGYQNPFQTLEQGVTDYVSNYLIPNKYY